MSVGKTIKFSLHIHLRFCVFMNIASRPTLLHIWVMLLFRASYRSTFSPLHFQGGLILCCLNHYHNDKKCHIHEAKTTLTLIISGLDLCTDDATLAAVCVVYVRARSRWWSSDRLLQVIVSVHYLWLSPIFLVSSRCSLPATHWIHELSPQKLSKLIS